jgi:ABC-2 type transport system permease protein
MFIFAIITKLVGMSVKSASFIKYFSFLTPYEPERFCMVAIMEPQNTWALWLHDPVRGMQLGPLGGSLILLGIGFAAYIAAGIVFERRDLPAPL